MSRYNFDKFYGYASIGLSLFITAFVWSCWCKLLREPSYIFSITAFIVPSQKLLKKLTCVVSQFNLYIHFKVCFVYNYFMRECWSKLFITFRVNNLKS